MCTGGAGQTKKKVDPVDRKVQEESGFQDKLEDFMGAGKKAAPASTPAGAPAESLEAMAAARGGQERSARRRRVRASSLLATGGAGDPAPFASYTPAAKPTLGS